MLRRDFAPRDDAGAHVRTRHQARTRGPDGPTSKACARNRGNAGRRLPTNSRARREGEMYEEL